MLEEASLGDVNLLVFWASMIFSSTGWVMLITGQAFVLYSRLGLILQNDRVLKQVKWLIITDALVFHPMVTIVQYGKTYGSEQAAFNDALFYIEKIQMTAFCIQEFIISGIYLWKTVEHLQLVSRVGTRRVMYELCILNVIIIIMDIALLSLEYKGLRTMERAFKPVVYSIKLKLEFVVLGKLINLVQSSQRSMSLTLAHIDSLPTPAASIRANRNPSKQLPDWMAELETGPSIHVEHV
ncbi:hypothetical protein LTS17_001921 [Exophiala oligosperma]